MLGVLPDTVKIPVNGYRKGERKLNKLRNSEKANSVSDYLSMGVGQLVLWMFVLLMVGFLSGCSWPVHHCYKGPELPLEEVAVLRTVGPVFVMSIDGEADAGRAQQKVHGLGSRIEYHMQPGTHSVTARYRNIETDGRRYTKTTAGKITKSFDLVKGYVYTLEGSIFGNRWTMTTVRSGTVYEIACSRNRFSDPAKLIFTAPWPGSQQWKEFTEKTRCPEESEN